ncbi:MAG: hypothetical protein ACRD0Y_01740 [Terriglobales bacterium]
MNHASLRVRWDEVRKSLGTPEALKKFAEIFTDLQLRRHACDYDPGITIFASDAHLANQAAREAIELLRTVGHEARRDFLSQLLLGKRAG